jgi:FdhE protein
MHDMKKIRRLWEKKLKALQPGDLLPAPLLGLVSRTVRMQLDSMEGQKAAPLDMSKTTESERHLKGVPLYPRSEFGFDRQSAVDLFNKLLAVLQEENGPMQSAAQTLEALLREGSVTMDQAFEQYLEGNDQWFLTIGEKTPDAPRLLNFLTQSSLTPGLFLFAGQLADHLDPSRTRQHGHCPVCGSPPLVGRLKNREGRRFLTCSFCWTEYRAKRLQCPFCSEQDTGRLEYFEAEGIPGYRVEVCRSCRRYIKTADFRNLDRPSHPPLDDLESLALDVLARENGFQRATLSAWGF